MIIQTRIKRAFSSVGPGIFIVGYVIGTGSVTTMASSGAKYGLSLTWALALSCLFTYIMIVAISRTTIASGETLIYSIRTHFGKGFALFLIFSLMLTELLSIMGVMGIATDILREWTKPLTPEGTGINPFLSTTVITGALYFLFWTGSHQFFLKAMAVVVGLMGICFVLTMLMIIPGPVQVLRDLTPSIPNEPQSHLIMAGMVGTTMASVCLITRSYLVAEKGWGLTDLRTENNDAMLSMVLTFVVSGAIVASAAYTMFPQGIEVVNAIDMVSTLKPLAGEFATAVFVFGILSAALSSIFPNYVLAPWMICDYLNIPRKMDLTWVRVLVLLIALTGFAIPIFGGRPVIIMIASQAVSPAVMPMLIVFVFMILNRQKNYRIPMVLKIGLIVTLIFSLFLSYSAVVGLMEYW